VSSRFVLSVAVLFLLSSPFRYADCNTNNVFINQEQDLLMSYSLTPAQLRCMRQKQINGAAWAKMKERTGVIAISHIFTGQCLARLGKLRSKKIPLHLLTPEQQQAAITHRLMRRIASDQGVMAMRERILRVRLEREREREREQQRQLEEMSDMEDDEEVRAATRAHSLEPCGQSTQMRREARAAAVAPGNSRQPFPNFTAEQLRQQARTLNRLAGMLELPPEQQMTLTPPSPLSTQVVFPVAAAAALSLSSSSSSSAAPVLPSAVASVSSDDSPMECECDNIDPTATTAAAFFSVSDPAESAAALAELLESDDDDGEQEDRPDAEDQHTSDEEHEAENALLNEISLDAVRFPSSHRQQHSVRTVAPARASSAAAPARAPLRSIVPPSIPLETLSDYRLYNTRVREQNHALKDVTAVFYSDEYNELYTGNKMGQWHLWTQ
jgi:hypothetical protein